MVKHCVKLRRLLFLSLLPLFALLLPSCTKKSSPIVRQTFSLDTLITITVYDPGKEKALDQCMKLLDEYHNRFSPNVEGSEVWKVNHRAPSVTHMEVSEDLAAMLSRGEVFSKMTHGAFDLTVYPLSSLWNFGADEPKRPSDAAIQAAVKKVGYQNLHTKGRELIFDKPYTQIDLGSIAKGYIADRLKDFLLKKGVKSALINLGGNLLAVGDKPGHVPFRLGLQKPFSLTGETLGIVQVRDISVVTSGVYQRFFREGNTVYSHLLDPRTGYPYQNGLYAVTVFCKSSTDADALSTALFSQGLEKGLYLAEQLKGVEAIFIDKNDKLHFTSGAKDYLVP